MFRLWERSKLLSLFWYFYFYELCQKTLRNMELWVERHKGCQKLEPHSDLCDFTWIYSVSSHSPILHAYQNRGIYTCILSIGIFLFGNYLIFQLLWMPSLLRGQKIASDSTFNSYFWRYCWVNQKSKALLLWTLSIMSSNKLDHSFSCSHLFAYGQLKM